MEWIGGIIIGFLLALLVGWFLIVRGARQMFSVTTNDADVMPSAGAGVVLHAADGLCPSCPHPAHSGVDCRSSDACGCGQ